MSVKLFDYQLDAIHRMKTGCILRGGVGSGKSLTSIGYYYLQNGGDENFLTGGEYVKMKDPKDLYIITTAKKRDSLEWDKELLPFALSKDNNPIITPYTNKVVIDSWNNIGKYRDVKEAFFIFDEQRVVGYGSWTKSFLKIAKENEWILLTATPGDTWMDYLPVFIANGYYKNKTEFEMEHVVYDHHVKFPKINRYVNTGRLIRQQRKILIDMDYHHEISIHHEDVYVKYDISSYKETGRLRWNPYTNEPIENASELCYTWRRIVNSDISRQIALLEIFENHPKLIVFYNYNYELDILRNLGFGNAVVAEWNGHKHELIPKSPSWVYLVQYAAGSEGWNCIQTNAMVFFSENYSYKIMTQAAGRIDRLSTPFSDLYYYHLKSKAPIDIAVARALREKKNFNEGKFVHW